MTTPIDPKLLKQVVQTEKAFDLLHPTVKSIYLSKEFTVPNLLHALALQAVIIIKKSTPQQAALDTFLKFFHRAMAEITLDSEGYLTADATRYFPSKKTLFDNDPKPS